MTEAKQNKYENMLRNYTAFSFRIASKRTEHNEAIMCVLPVRRARSIDWKLKQKKMKPNYINRQTQPCVKSIGADATKFGGGWVRFVPNQIKNLQRNASNGTLSLIFNMYIVQCTILFELCTIALFTMYIAQRVFSPKSESTVTK